MHGNLLIKLLKEKSRRSLIVATALSLTWLPPSMAKEPEELPEHLPQAEVHEPAPTPGRPKIALALGGGGARGLVNIGALRVLEREHIPIDMVAGTSMGAIVGGLYCAGVTPDEIQKRVLSSKLRHAFYTVPLTVRVALMPVFFMPRIVGIHPYEGLYRGNKFAKYLNKAVPEGQRNIEDLKIPFAAVASNLLDGKAYALNKGNLGRAIQASSAVPFLRKPVVLDDGLFVDGGVEANLPVKQAKAMGADIVIAVNADEGPLPMERKDFRKVMSVSNRVVTMLICKIDEPQVAAADVVISPDVNGIKILSTKKTDGERAIEQGEQAAERALPFIRAKLAQYGYPIAIDKPVAFPLVANPNKPVNVGVPVHAEQAINVTPTVGLDSDPDSSAHKEKEKAKVTEKSTVTAD